MKPTPLRILVVDDEAFVREFHALSLVRAGFSVTWASDGVGAMAWLANETFDAVVSDIVMPNMDGLKLLQTIVKRFPSLPVILVSGSVRPDTEELARAWGAAAVLEKPVNAAQLAAVVKSACSDGRHIPSSEESSVLELESVAG